MRNARARALVETWNAVASRTPGEIGARLAAEADFTVLQLIRFSREWDAIREPAMREYTIRTIAGPREDRAAVLIATCDDIELLRDAYARERAGEAREDRLADIAVRGRQLKAKEHDQHTDSGKGRP